MNSVGRGLLFVALSIIIALVWVRVVTPDTVVLDASDGKVRISADAVATALGVPGGSVAGVPYASTYLHGDGTWGRQASGTSLPATCTSGDFFFYDTDNSWYKCSATDTWTQASAALPSTVSQNITFSGVLTVPSGNCCAATCTTGDVFLDTTGATKEWCVCVAANTWNCVAVTAGPAD